MGYPIKWAKMTRSGLIREWRESGNLEIGEFTVRDGMAGDDIVSVCVQRESETVWTGWVDPWSGWRGQKFCHFGLGDDYRIAYRASVVDPFTRRTVGHPFTVTKWGENEARGEFPTLWYCARFLASPTVVAWRMEKNVECKR